MASGFRIEHRLGVPAPAHVVWEVVSDLSGWPAWNPLYVKAEGALRIGGALTLTERLGGHDHVIKPRIIDWTPDEQILWGLTELGGLVRRVRYIEIEKLTEEGCIFSNGEDWRGRFAAMAGRSRARLLREGFEAMGEAVRDQAVARWRAEGGASS